MTQKINLYLFYIYLFLFTLTFFEGTFKMPLLKIADEITLILSVLILISAAFRKTINRLTFVFILALTCYLFYQILNYLFSPFNLNIGISLLQSLINLKLFIVSFTFILITLNIDISKYFLNRTVRTFTLIFFLGILLNLIFQESWNNLFNWKNEYRYGFLRPAGIFGATHFNSYFISFLSLAYYLIHVKKKSSFPSIKKLGLFSIFQLLISFPLTIRKGLIGLLPLIYFTFKDQNRSLKTLYISLSVVLFFAFAYIIRDSSIVSDTLFDLTQMTNNDRDNYYIRGLMIYNGLMLSMEFFPFGAGSATFGTVLSQFNTLEVYKHTHIPEFWYSGKKLSGIYDSGFFSFLGENGWLGLALLVFIIRAYLKKIFYLLNENGKKHFINIFIFTLILSVSEPVFQNGIFTVIYSFTLLYIIKLESRDST